MFVVSSKPILTNTLAVMELDMIPNTDMLAPITQKFINAMSSAVVSLTRGTKSSFDGAAIDLLASDGNDLLSESLVTLPLMF